MKKFLMTLVIFISIILVVTGCNNNEKVEKTEEDVHVITEEGVTKSQEIEGLSFTNTALTVIDEETYFQVDVTNNKDEALTFDHIDVIFKNSNDEVIATIYGSIGSVLEAGETRTLEASTIENLSDAENIEYEVVE